MRLWSLHPKYLDRQGLLALWREALLAQAVLAGRTRGYLSHPQLDRFRARLRPLSLIAAYLHEVWKEANRRGYQFDASRIVATPARRRLEVAAGQVSWEWTHLRRKLRLRSPAAYRCCRDVIIPQTHPLFRRVTGGRADWERGARPGRPRGD